MTWCNVWNFAKGAGQIAPAITALVALAAAAIALWSISAQRSIARKRAAIDFFLKTETDSYMLNAWGQFEKARDLAKDCTDIPAFKKTPHWQALRNYLNLHELMAVAVNKQVLDESVCFNFWRGELHRAYRDSRRVIEYIQSQPDEKQTYTELVKLYSDWSKRSDFGLREELAPMTGRDGIDSTRHPANS